MENHDQSLETQRNVLALCQWIVETYGSQMNLSASETADAMILAAGQGYSAVVSFLHSKVPASINSTSGIFSPISAAITYGKVDTFNALLKLGASLSRHELDSKFAELEGPCNGVSFWFPYRPLANSRGNHMYSAYVDDVPPPTLLHMAVASNSCEIVELLIQHGAVANEACDVLLHNEGLEDSLILYWPPNTRHHSWTLPRMSVSPLRLAIISKYWDVALALTTLGATPTRSDLVAAAEGGSLDLVRQLVRMGLDPNSAAEDGMSALQAALSFHHREVARLLYVAGGTVASADFDTAFQILDVVDIRALLLQQQPESPTGDGRGSSLLECAILSGRSDVIDLVLSLHPTAYDSGALCAAVYMATVEGLLPDEGSLLAELLRRRAQDLGRNCHIPVLENTAVSLAALYSRPDILTRLLAHRRWSPMDQSAVMPSKLLGSLLRYGEWNKREVVGWREIFRDAEKCQVSSLVPVSPLLSAIQGQNQQIISALLDAGYKADGFALKAAIREKLPFNLVQRIIKHCTDVDAKCALDYGPELTNYQTPLTAAASQGRIDLLQVLLSHGAHLNEVRQISGGQLYTALTVAMDGNQCSTVEFLLDQGAKTNEPAWSPEHPFAITPLQFAAHAGYIGIAQRLIAQGADINARRCVERGYTALEGAAMNGRLDMVHLLLNSNVHTEGYSRLQYVRATSQASKNGHGAVLALLKSHRLWTAEDQAIWEEPGYILENCFLHPKEHSRGELVRIVARLDDAYFRNGFDWPFCPTKWGKSAATEVLKYADVVVAVRPEITVADAADDAAGVADSAFQKWSGKTLEPGFWLASDFEDSQGALSAVSQVLQKWATSLIKTETPTISDALEDLIVTEDGIYDLEEAQLGMSWSLNVKEFGEMMEICEDGKLVPLTLSPICHNHLTDLSDNVQQEDIQREPSHSSPDYDMEEDGEEARRRAILKDMLGEEEAPFMPFEFQL